MDSRPNIMKIIQNASPNRLEKENEEYFHELKCFYEDYLNEVNFTTTDYSLLVGFCYFWLHYVETHTIEVFEIFMNILSNSNLKELVKVKNYLKNYVYYGEYNFEIIEEILTPLLKVGNGMPSWRRRKILRRLSKFIK